MSLWRKELGKKGEAAAWRALQKQGFKLEAMNYTVRGGELDLVVSKGAKVVFVEVKTRTTTEYGEPLESITPLKTRHLYRTAQIFLQEKGWDDVEVEFWAAAVYADKEQRIKKVEIFPNIFV